MSSTSQKPLIGISSCLAGNSVRYDGKHKLNSLIFDTLSEHAALLPICPEAMAGLGIPRPPVHIIQTGTYIQAIGKEYPDLNVTQALVQMGKIITRTYPNLCGFIAQSRSPSCGFGSTPIYNEKRILNRTGNGLFIEVLHQQWPDMPILDHRNPSRSVLLAFFKQVTCYQNRRRTIQTTPTIPNE